MSASEQIARQFANAAANKNAWSTIIINVKAYGAKGDGVTDDTASIQAGVNACPNGGILLLPAGSSFVVTSTLSITKSLTIIGYGAKILSQVEASDNTIEFIGSAGNFYNITADITAGSKTFTVSAADSLNFAAGDYFKIQTDENYWIQTGLDYKKGEIVKISSVDTGTGQITIDGVGIELGYTQADMNLKCQKITTIDSPMVEGLKIEGSGTDNQQVGLTFKYCKNARVAFVEISDFEVGAEFQACVGGNFVHSSVYDCNRAGTGYGVQVGSASQNISVLNNKFENNRHSFTTTGFDGVCIGIDVSHNSVNNNMVGFALDAHGNARHILFSFNKIRNANGGINSRSPYTTVKNNEISHVNTVGINLYEIGGINCKITGNTVEYCDTTVFADAIKAEISAGVSGNETCCFVIVKDNTINDFRNGNGISINSQPINCDVSSNDIYFYGFNAISVNGADQLMIRSNLIHRAARSTQKAIVAVANNPLILDTSNGSHAAISENTLVTAGQNIQVSDFGKLRLSGNVLDGATKYTLTNIDSIIADELLRSPDGTLYKLQAADDGTISGVTAY